MNERVKNYAKYTFQHFGSRTKAIAQIELEINEHSLDFNTVLSQVTFLPKVKKELEQNY